MAGRNAFFPVYDIIQEDFFQSFHCLKSEDPHKNFITSPET